MHIQDEVEQPWQAERLTKARLQLVSAAQWLARVGRSYGSPVDGEKVALLDWQHDETIATRQFASNLRVELDMKTLTMQFTEDGHPSDHKIEIEDHSPAHVEAWLLIELLHRGIDRNRFTKELPYDTTGLMSGDAEEFSPGEYQAELNMLATSFANAARVLEQVAGDAGSAATPLYIAPQSLCLEARIGTLRIGFSLGDGRSQVPYFYTARNDRAASWPESVLKVPDIETQTKMRSVSGFFAEQLKQSMH